MVAGWAGGLAQWGGGVVACWAEAQWGGGLLSPFFLLCLFFLLFFFLFYV